VISCRRPGQQQPAADAGSVGRIETAAATGTSHDLIQHPSGTGEPNQLPDCYKTVVDAYPFLHVSSQ
jgi:hypothetical protein